MDELAAVLNTETAGAIHLLAGVNTDSGTEVETPVLPAGVAADRAATGQLHGASETLRGIKTEAEVRQWGETRGPYLRQIRNLWCEHLN